MARVLLMFEPPDGGVAENVLQLALALGRHGHEVELAGPSETPVYERVASLGLPVHRTSLRRGYGDPRADARSLRELRGILRVGRYDLVHCHSAKAGVLGRLAVRKRIPLVYSPHCFPFIGEFGTPRRLFATATEKALGPLTSMILCVCEQEREVALEHKLVPPERARVIYNGSPPCDGSAELDAAMVQLRGDGVLAAAVTVLRAQKSVHVLLEAVPAVLAAVADARIAVVGDGPERDALHARAAELGLDAEPRFAFLPFAAPPARHLRAADVYVLPSSWEAFPIGVLEALACGVPQVATDVGGTREAVVPETGRTVPAHDPAALAQALVELLGDAELRASMSAASVARHTERFGLERMVGETSALYDEVIARAR